KLVAILGHRDVIPTTGLPGRSIGFDIVIRIIVVEAAIRLLNAAWEKQRKLFLQAVERQDQAPATPNRSQDRRHEQPAVNLDAR
ncbi:hypothetical protein C2W62_53855, partial [Candidatus Entotheonella serta]